MMALESPRLNVSMTFLDPSGPSAPAAQVAGKEAVLQGKLDDDAKLRELAGGCDVVTFEIEHVGVGTLSKMEEEGTNVQPSSRVVGIIQDKLTQKRHFQEHDVPLPPFVDIPDVKSIHDAAGRLGLPIMLKARKGGYDGRGNAVLNDTSDEAIAEALTSLGAGGKTEDLGLYAEGWIDFHKEVAVMVVRSTSGETRAYPTVTAVQTDSICRVVLAPARGVPASVRHRCEAVAMKAIDSLGNGATGVFGVELFLTRGEGGDPSKMGVLLNEVAPRPHNTGHYTQDACAVSQFENHLRAVCGLPLGDTSMCVGAAAMVNVLGAKSGTTEDTLRGSNAALAVPRATVHWYGKAGCRKGRKMGHINLTADSHGELDGRLKDLLALEDIPESVIPGDGLGKSPLVGVIMGSQSDLPTMQAAVEILKKFGVPYEVDIVSAHRTPDKLCSYSRSAAERGLQCIIAGAGGAAHLPGMVASMTPLPVVGVPIKTSTLNGQDSLLSIVQMPRGIPVATVAIGNAQNAGLLAVRILASSRPELREQMETYQRELKEMVNDMSDRLTALGSDAFLEGMENKSKAVNV